MASTTKPVVAFRVLLRAVQDTFKGDAAALQKCRVEARKQFRANGGERDAARVSKLVADALDAANFIRESVVQAKLNEQGQYAMKLKPQDGAGEGKGGKLELQPAGSAQQSAKEGGSGGGGGGGGGCEKPGGCGCG